MTWPTLLPPPVCHTAFTPAFDAPNSRGVLAGRHLNRLERPLKVVREPLPLAGKRYSTVPMGRGEKSIPVLVFTRREA